MGRAAETKAKAEEMNVISVAVSPDKLAFDYKIDGKADFRPVRVLNDGEKTYITMSEDVRRSEYPILMLIDENGNAMVVDYRRKLNEKTGEVTYEVDKLFAKAELRRGDEKVRITWQRKEKSLFSWGRD